MAKAKKSLAKPKSTGSSRRNAKKKQAVQDNGLKQEIILCVILAVSVLLFISNFGIGGFIGNSVSGFFFGMFGVMAYIFPVLLFIGSAFYIANRENSFVVRKLFGCALFFIFLCAFMQLLMGGYQENTAIGDYYILSAQDKLGGGLLGGILVTVCSFAFGVVGAYVLILVGLIISAIILTQRPLVSQFRSKSASIYREAKAEQKKRREEQKRTRKAEEEQKKQMNPEPLEIEKPKRTYTTEMPEFLINRGEGALDTVLPTQKEKKLPDGQNNDGNKSEVPPFDFSLTQESGIGRPDLHCAEMESTNVPGSTVPDLKPVESVAESQNQTSPEQEVPHQHKSRNPRSSKEEIENNIHNIKSEIHTETKKPKKAYKMPPLSLLKIGDRNKGDSNEYLRETAAKLQDTLRSFKVNAIVTNASCGPTVTRYELQPEQGVKVSKIVSLQNDIKLNLAARDIRIEAPIPGKAAVGIEVPNREKATVWLKELFQSEAFIHTKASLPFAVGKDIAGKTVVADIAKMPHVLIAGATGSGKSVCINTLIMSLLYKAKPDDVKLIMIDPKVVELSVYNGIPHLLIPVVTDPKKAAGSLNWAVAEMMERYNTFAEFNVRDVGSYNEKVRMMIADPDIPEEDKPKKLPKIVIIVDELADLMMVAPGEVEDAICRLAQLARAAGIHLVIATQRPSVDVITGLIKANMPSRIAFMVSSGVDSRTILDMNGAEKLLGNGDMLFFPQGYSRPVRLQGAYITDEEVSDVTKFLSSQSEEVVYNTEIESKINAANAGTAIAGGGSGPERDAYFVEAGRFIIEKDKASIGMLQRMFKIGFNRAARIMDQLCEAGVVGEEEGTKPRKVLMSMEQFEQVIEELL